MSKSERTRREEIANAVVHGIGALLGCAALSLLVVFASLRGSAYHIVSCSIYGATLVVLYTLSALYHALRGDRAKRIFRTLDHSAIFLLIAGTYTPFLLVTLRGAWGWSLFGVLWGMAGLGIVLEWVCRGRFRVLSVPVYLIMGWIALLALRPLTAALAGMGLTLVIAGGVTYTLGVVFYVMKRVPFAHTVWHAFVLGGSVCHFFAVMFYVVPSS